MQWQAVLPTQRQKMLDRERQRGGLVCSEMKIIRVGQERERDVTNRPVRLFNQRV